MVWEILAQDQPVRAIVTGQLLYLQGTEADCFYYLLRGSVRSYVSTSDGTERTLTVHHSGDLMGEASFFDRCPRVSSAVALQDSQVVSVTRERLNGLFAQHPELAMPMLQHLSRTVRTLSDHLHNASLPVEQRIVRYLLALPSDQTHTVSCTHESIGQAVGASRVTVSRVLGRLAGRGLIHSGYGVIRLLHPEQLAQLTERPG